jgi:hypothetical protein
MLAIDWTVVIIILVIVLGSWIIFRGETVGGVLVIVAGCSMFVPLYINAKLTLSALCVDAQGITAIAFGRTWKSMKWTDVKEIRSSRWTDVGSSKSTRKFLIYSKTGERFYLKKRGPLVFNESIIGFEALLNILHDRAHRYGFDMITAGE